MNASAELSSLDTIHWKGANDEMLLSPRHGGRIISWKHRTGNELVKALMDVTEGGLLRVLLGEERYPGASYVTPHLSRVLQNDERGFQIRLRHLWNTPGAIARLIGWPDKANPTYLDGLLLDKVVTFDAALSALIVDLSVTNMTGEVRRITPWLHSHFDGWVHDAFIVMDGEKQRYLWHDIFWAGHRAESKKSMRLVHTSKDQSLSAMLGASTDWLAGMNSYTRADFGETSTEGCMELRGQTIPLAPHQRWRANAFLALTDGGDGWRRWATESPVPLFSHVEDANEMDWNPASLLPLLDHWALPEERGKGLMVLSYLDKVPFTSANRYSASNSFDGFRLEKTRQRAQASVVLVPLRSLDAIHIELTGSPNWRAKISGADRGGSVLLKQNQPASLILDGPADLAGNENIQVRISNGGQMLAALRIEPDATVGPQYDHQVKQTSTYLDERWRSEKAGFLGTTVDELTQWQSQTRQRLLRWMDHSVMGPAPLAPRLVERQIGPYCIREKILIQTERDLWLPMYLVRPRRVEHGEKLPAILFPHGSGPGKQSFAPDETETMQNASMFDQWPMPYQLAHQLGCIVLIPDRRGCGEWSEANHGQRWQRAWRAGYNLPAMDAWDHFRAVDYLVQRPDVDTRRIVSMGSSGGGWLTLVLLGMDERIAGGIVSSTVTTLPSLPDQYFFQTFADENAPINPPPHLMLAPSTMLCLAAPRVLWIMDGKWDRGILPALPHTKEEAQAAFERWHAEANAGREEIARVYRLLGAEKNYQSSWFDGDHLAGFTFNHIAAWLRQHFKGGSSHE